MCSGVCWSSDEVGEALNLGNNPIEAMLTNKKKSIRPGPLGQLKPLEEELLKYTFKQHEQGIKVSTLCIFVLASNLFTAFGKKDFVAKCSAIKHFLHAHLLANRMSMHICQRKLEEVEAEASNYMRLIRPLLFGPHCNRCFILNMDQTPVFFDEHKKDGIGG
jgi:hypothetical protein